MEGDQDFMDYIKKVPYDKKFLLGTGHVFIKGGDRKVSYKAKDIRLPRGNPDLRNRPHNVNQQHQHHQDHRPHQPDGQRKESSQHPRKYSDTVRSSTPRRSGNPGRYTATSRHDGSSKLREEMNGRKIDEEEKGKKSEARGRDPSKPPVGEKPKDRSRRGRRHE